MTDTYQMARNLPDIKKDDNGPWVYVLVTYSGTHLDPRSEVVDVFRSQHSAEEAAERILNLPGNERVEYGILLRCLHN